MCWSDTEACSGVLVSFEATKKLCEAVHERLRRSVLKAVTLIFGRCTQCLIISHKYSDLILYWHDLILCSPGRFIWATGKTALIQLGCPRRSVTSPRKIHKSSLVCPVWKSSTFQGRVPSNQSNQSTLSNHLFRLWHFLDGFEMICDDLRMLFFKF